MTNERKFEPGDVVFSIFPWPVVWSDNISPEGGMAIDALKEDRYTLVRFIVCYFDDETKSDSYVLQFADEGEQEKFRVASEATIHRSRRIRVEEGRVGGTETAIIGRCLESLHLVSDAIGIADSRLRDLYSQDAQ